MHLPELLNKSFDNDKAQRTHGDLLSQPKQLLGGFIIGNFQHFKITYNYNKPK